MTTPKPFATTAFALADAMSRLGREAVAGVVGVSATTLYKACNPNLPRELDFLAWHHCRRLAALLRAKGLPEWFSVAFDNEVERAAGGLRALPNASLERLAVEVAAETGDVQRVVLEAVSDTSEGGSSITHDEAKKAVTEIEEAIERLQAMKQRIVQSALR